MTPVTFYYFFHQLSLSVTLSKGTASDNKLQWFWFCQFFRHFGKERLSFSSCSLQALCQFFSVFLSFFAGALWTLFFIIQSHSDQDVPFPSQYDPLQRHCDKTIMHLVRQIWSAALCHYVSLSQNKWLKNDGIMMWLKVSAPTCKTGKAGYQMQKEPCRTSWFNHRTRTQARS